MNDTTPIDAAALDRLVDGELDEAARAALLRSLDREPDGWKRCALAFLEAQAWRESMQSLPASTHQTAAHRPAPWAALRQAVSIAAVVAVAFCLGFISRGTNARQDTAAVAQTRPDTARVPPRLPPAAQAPSPVPEYVRRRMEREGYRVEGGRKVIEVALDDGRRVAVPVDSVSYRYVGQRIH